MKARMIEAVASGRMVMPLSAKLYISFSTTSVAAPMERTNSSVFSRIGMRISCMPNRSKMSRARCSIYCQRTTLSGRMSLKPLIA